MAMVRHNKVTRRLLEGIEKNMKEQRERLEAYLQKIDDRRLKTTFFYDLRRSDPELKEEEEYQFRYNIGEFLKQSRLKLQERLAELEKEANKVTALDVFRVLPEQRIQELRQQFEQWEKFEGGSQLTIEPFVEMLLNCLFEVGYEGTEEEVEEQRRLLRELFYAIDYDGSGAIDWDEFTTYMMASLDARGLRQDDESIVLIPSASLQLAPQSGNRGEVQFHKGKVNEYHVVEYFDDRSVLTVVDSAANSIRARTELEFGTNCVTYIPEEDMYVAMRQRWGMKSFTLQDHPTFGSRFLPIHSAHIVETPYICKWCPEMQLLFGGTTKGVVQGFSLANLRSTPCVPQFSKNSHRGEPVSALLPIPRNGRLISACMFGGITVTDVRHEAIILEVGREEERNTGVHHLLYMPELNLLVTGGHNPNLQIWMLVPRSSDPRIGKLVDNVDPHKNSIVCLWQQPLKYPNIVFSADEAGMMKIWDLRKMRCLSTTELFKPQAGSLASQLFHSRSVSADDEKLKLYVYGSTVETHESLVREVSIHPKYVLDRKKDEHDMIDIFQTCCLYNPLTRQVISAANRHIVTYLLDSGKVYSFYDRISSSTVTAMALDPNFRRLHVGTERGDLFTVNPSTGEITFVFEKRPREISGILTYQKYLIVACHDGTVTIYATDQENGKPVCCAKISASRILSLGRNESSHLFCCGDVTGQLVNFEVRDGRFFLAACSTPKQSNFVWDENEKPGEQRDKAETNFKTDKQIFRYMSAPTPEFTACEGLSPFPAFVAADTSSFLALWSTFPCALVTEVARWEHYTPRAVLSGLSKSVVTAMTFFPPRELICVDDQGCCIIWDIHALITASRLDQVHSRSSREDRLAALVVPESIAPTVLHCFVVAKNVPLVSIALLSEEKVLMVGVSSGHTQLLSFEGKTLGMMYPDQKYRTEAPPNYLFSKLAQEASIAAADTRAKVLWRKLRTYVLGGAYVMSKLVTDAQARLKTHARDVVADRTDIVSDGALLLPSVVPWPPPSSPSQARALTQNCGVFVFKNSSAVIVDRDHVKPAQLAKLKSWEASETKRNAALDAMVTSALEKLSVLRAREVQWLKEKAEEEYKLTKVRQPLPTEDEGVLLFHDIALLRQPQIFEASIIAALASPSQWMLPLDAAHLAAAPRRIQREIAQFTPGEIRGVSLVGVTTASPIPRPKPVVMHSIEELTPAQRAAKLAPSVIARMDAASQLKKRKSPEKVLLPQQESKPRFKSDFLSKTDESDLASRLPTTPQHLSLPVEASMGGQSFQEEKHTFQGLLKNSAPLYPVQESPFLNPSRPAPVLTPYLFSPELVDDTELSFVTAEVDRTIVAPSHRVPDPVAELFSTNMRNASKIISRFHPAFIKTSLNSWTVKKLLESPAHQRQQVKAARAEQGKRRTIPRMAGSAKGVKSLKQPSSRPLPFTQRTQPQGSDSYVMFNGRETPDNDHAFSILPPLPLVPSVPSSPQKPQPSEYEYEQQREPPACGASPGSPQGKRSTSKHVPRPGTASSTASSTTVIDGWNPHKLEGSSSGGHKGRIFKGPARPGSRGGVGVVVEQQRTDGLSNMLLVSRPVSACSLSESQQKRPQTAPEVPTTIPHRSFPPSVTQRKPL